MIAPGRARLVVQRGLNRLAFAILALTLAACGQPQAPAPPPPAPLQSPIQPPGNVTVVAPTQQLIPTAAPAATLTNTPGLVPTVVRTPFVFHVGTPNTQATSQAVILTITALAGVPTRVPPVVPTRVPPRPIGAGGRGRVTQVPTPTLDPSGISLLSLSRKVYRGGAITVSIRTKPSAQCLIHATREQADGATSDVAVPNAARVAGSDGAIAWIWPVGNDVPVGQLSLRAECGDAGSARYTVEIE